MHDSTMTVEQSERAGKKEVQCEARFHFLDYFNFHDSFI